MHTKPAPAHPRLASVLALSLAAFACEAGGPRDVDPLADDTTDSGDAPGTDDSTGTDDASDSPSPGDMPEEESGGEAPGETGDEQGCPLPEVAPQLVDDPEFFCSEGFSFDAAYRLCVSETAAIGPFPPAMVEACQACGGVDCEEAYWPVDQARGLRGTNPCWPGTTPLASICVDDEHGWGPFSPIMVAGCKDAGGGEVTCESMRWARSFAENLLPPELGGDWSWIMPVDYGLRDDAGGGGAFSAPRLNNPGGHSGIDVLAPVGTPLFAPCEGPVFVGYDGGYGNYVQLACPIPDVIAGETGLWASLLFAHLDSLAVASNATVTPGQMIGTVGKTGNAGSQTINPHVHFEIAIHSSLAAAQAETHASANHSSNAASDQFAPRFSSECLSVLAFDPIDGPVMKGRRPDPFMLMSCLSSDKPTLTQPGAGLQAGWTKWSEHYASTVFDVDVGL